MRYLNFVLNLISYWLACCNKITRQTKFRQCTENSRWQKYEICYAFAAILYLTVHRRPCGESKSNATNWQVFGSLDGNHNCRELDDACWCFTAPIPAATPASPRRATIRFIPFSQRFHPHEEHCTARVKLPARRQPISAWATFYQPSYRAELKARKLNVI